MRRDQAFEQVIRRLSILEAQFHYTIVDAVYVDWETSLSAHFSFLEDISYGNPKELAAAITTGDSAHFQRLCIEDFQPNSDNARIHDMISRWSTLADDVMVCATANSDLVEPISEVVKVCGQFPINLFGD